LAAILNNTLLSPSIVIFAQEWWVQRAALWLSWWAEKRARWRRPNTYSALWGLGGCIADRQVRGWSPRYATTWYSAWPWRRWPRRWTWALSTSLSFSYMIYFYIINIITILIVRYTLVYTSTGYIPAWRST